jgi:opacity protein-like surface antigen
VRGLALAALVLSLTRSAAASDEEPPVLPVPVELPPPPHPRVQWTLTLDVGGGGATRETSPREPEGIFHLAAHSLVLFGRKTADYVGAGLCLDAGSWDMNSLVAGSGLAVLIPLGAFLPFVVEAWPHYLYTARGHSGGVTARLWWGIHGRNYLKSHVTVVGLYVQASRSFGVPEEQRWVVVAGFDFSMILPMLPFTALASLIFR